VAERTPQPVSDRSCGRSVRPCLCGRVGRPSSRPHTWVRRALWIALFAAVLGASLWLGANRSTPATPAARVEAIASQLRCPVCIDESAAQANTAAARAIRANVAARLRAGQSDRQIIDYMVSRYGRWILLSPPATGFGLTVWLAPVAVTLGALGVVAVAWTRAVRRFKETGPSATGEEHDPTAGGRGGQADVLADQAASTSKEGSSS
jgi:cytochrome c-type biogenesis protein CcmH